PYVRRGGALRLPQRSVVGRCLVADLPSDVSRTGRVRGNLRAGKSNVPATRRRFRDAAPGGGFTGRRCGGAQAFDHQPRRSPAGPVALDGRALSGTTGAVLDPVAAVRERVRLAPGAFVRVTFATGVAPDRPTALALVRKYRDASAAARAFSMASTHVHITL